MNIAAIILAAGLSSRMGDLKPLLHLGHRSLLEHCTRLFRQAGINRVVAVIGHRSEEITRAAEHLQLEWILNPEYEQGMFTSIQTGVRALAPYQPDGYFVLPVDIPLIRPVTVSTILSAYSCRRDLTAIPFFAGKPGHPPLLPASLSKAIIHHDGSGGLRALLNQYPCNSVQVWDQGILLDADTPGDFSKLSSRYRRLSIPSQDETLALAQLLVPKVGREHGRMVARAALTMGRALVEKGLRLDQDLLFAGGWLHDLAKGQPNHGHRAAAKLKALGLPEVAAAVVDHSDLAPAGNGHLEERHLICLADKAVSGCSLVEPVKRYRDKLIRFRHSPAALDKIRIRMEHGLALQQHFEQVSGCSLLPLLHGAIQ